MPDGYSPTALSWPVGAAVQKGKVQRRRADTGASIAMCSGISNENLEDVWGHGWKVNYSYSLDIRKP